MQHHRMPARQSKEAALTDDLREQLGSLGSRGSSVSADEWRELGNACFKNASYLSSIRCYTKAIERSGGGGGRSMAALHSNRSAAYLQSSMFAGPSLALKDAERAVAFDGTWYKGYVRLGDAQLARAQLYDAKRAYERALQLEPTCRLAKEALHTVDKEIFLFELDNDGSGATEQQGGCDGGAQDESPPAGLHDRDLYDTTHGGAPTGEGVDRRRCGRSRVGQTSATNGRPSTTYHSAADEEQGGGRRFEFHTKAVDPDTLCPSRRCAPTSEETERLIETWKTDTYVPEDHTAMRPRSVALTQAMRDANAQRESDGSTYKDQLMRTFRSRLQQDANLSATLNEKHIQEQLVGEGVNYRCGDKYRAQYAHSTDGIGLGITADALKDHLGLDKKW